MYGYFLMILGALMVYFAIFKWPKPKIHYIVTENIDDINPEIINSISKVIRKDKIYNVPE
jgi:hypothetical protein